MRRIMLAILVLGSTLVASAETRDIKASRDNSIWEDSAGSVSNGRGTYCFIGKNSGGITRRTLMQFELAEIPSFATVTNVSLTLHASRTAGGTVNVTLQKILASWGEGTSNAEGMEGGGAFATDGDATWMHRSWPNVLWNTPGGDFAPTVSASRTVSGFGTYTWNSTPLMVADVQSWISNPSTNYGWMVRGQETGTRNAKRLDTRESPDLTVRPRLTVTYTLPEPASVFTLLLLGGIALRRR